VTKGLCFLSFFLIIAIAGCSAQIPKDDTSMVGASAANMRKRYRFTCRYLCFMCYLSLRQADPHQTGLPNQGSSRFA